MNLPVILMKIRKFWQISLTFNLQQPNKSFLREETKTNLKKLAKLYSDKEFSSPINKTESKFHIKPTVIPVSTWIRPNFKIPSKSQIDDAKSIPSDSLKSDVKTEQKLQETGKDPVEMTLKVS